MAGIQRPDPAQAKKQQAGAGDFGTKRRRDEEIRQEVERYSVCLTPIGWRVGWKLNRRWRYRHHGGNAPYGYKGRDNWTRAQQKYEGSLTGQKQSRGESLLDKHQASKAAKKDKEEPPAIWDHARDMGVTGRLLNNDERAAKIERVCTVE